ncbi:Rnf-Nqr domain containing protein [Pseudomonas sp. 2FG]|uniref:Rnf-Nqr domain containing protein n=1 Tax=Pseudomonas sp. 2FG TaxID=2502191 RepID=UPI0010F4AC23|nr:Rnf-Nqr domain containing protein [Pseudomonas sp. 2FG]
MTELFLALLGAALVNNLFLMLPAGADALRARRVRLLGPASALLILFATPLAWLLQSLLLEPLELSYLRLFVLMPLLAPLAWLSSKVLARLRPQLPQDGLWPLLLGNGAALAAMLLASQPAASFALALALGLGGGLGFWLALALFTDLLGRIEQADIPAPFKGAPVMLICAGLMGLAFLGFNGLGFNGFGLNGLGAP